MSDAETSDVTSATDLPFWKKALFSGILLLVFFGILEGMAQVYLRAYRGYGGEAFLQYQFDPYKNIHLSRSWTDTRGVVHNEQGFRESESVALAADEGTYRIVLMGASTAYGLGGMFPHLQNDYPVLDNSETIDTYMEEILTDALPYERVEVINAGIPSIWTHHHLIYLNQTILRYEPDLILFLDGWNDHFHTDPGHDQFAAYAQTEQAQAIMGPPTISSLVRANLWWWFRKSAAVQVTGRVVRDIRTALAGTDSPPVHVEEALENVQVVFRDNALRMIDRNAAILSHEGIPAIFLLQPMLILERDRLDRMPEIERALFDFNVEWQDGFEEFMVRATPMISGMIEETVTPQGHRYMDLTAIYPESEGQIFTDYAHLTPEGNRILATVVSDEIIEMLGETGSDSVAVSQASR